MAKQMKNIVTRRQNRHRSKSPQGIDISDMGGKRTRYEKYDTSPILGRSSFSKGGGFTSGYGAERGYGAGYRDRQRSLLQTVIRNLVDSNDEEERITQRNKLQNDLEVTSERLDNLVQEHRDKLHGTLETFKKMDERIRHSKEQIRQVRASLTSCKSLLRCKRDELKRLWLEDVKYKHMLQMIDNIEDVRSVQDQLLKYRQSKHYLHATELLKNTVARLEGELSCVEALKDLKLELIAQKENFHEELIDELHRHLYVKATAKKKNVSPVLTEVHPSPSPSKKSVTLTRRGSRSSSRLGSASTSSGTKDDDQVVEELKEGINPEDDSSHFMAIIVESLSILGKVHEALVAIHERMEREFLLIIERASVQVTRQSDQEAGISGQRLRGVVRVNQPKLLKKVLLMCFEKFRNVVQAHSVLLGHLQRAKRVYKRDMDSVQLYEVNDVWAAIQQVLQNALEVYLAFNEEGSPYDGMAGLGTFSGTSDIQALFSPKRKPITRVTKKPLFRFDSSRHAISVHSYMKEQRDIELVEGGLDVDTVAHSNRHFTDDQPSIAQHLVCKPHNRNITVIFGVVRDFVLEIEEALRLQQDDHCNLYHFLHAFLEEDFLERVRYEYLDKIQSCAKPETAKTLAPDQKTTKVTGTKLCVLNSVITVWQIVEDLRQLMKDLPMYSASFLSILCQLLQGYRDTLQQLYRELTSVASEVSGGGRQGGGGGVGGAGTGMGHDSIISSKWARDEDINRMIRSLPNWMKLHQGSKSRGAEDDRMHSVYTKESETLTKNLGSEPIYRNNVVLNHENLRLIAILHESMVYLLQGRRPFNMSGCNNTRANPWDWFNSRLKQVVFELTNRSLGGSTSPPGVQLDMPDGGSASRLGMTSPGGVDALLDPDQNLDLMEQFSKIQFDFQTLAETTIIMLHLEVRFHCFYYLLPAVQKSDYTYKHEGAEEEPGVKQLATDMKDIDQVMVAVLSPDKYQYLFEGLGHLVASIFIASSQHLRSINNNGIKKMCRNISVLQSCLSKITLIREKDLDRARRYFEMLYLTHEEILHQLNEQGLMYTQKEYSNAFTLLARSSQPPISDEKLKKYLGELDTVFSQDTV